MSKNLGGIVLSRQLAVGFAVGVSVGAGGTFLFLTATNRERYPVPGIKIQPGSSTAVTEYHPALKFGVPQTEVLRFFKGYVASFDYKTRNPKWVMEHITRESAGLGAGPDAKGGGDRGKSDFAEDKDIDPRFRSRLSDYRNSGYDRGHMAPAANHKGSQQEMDETFSLVNVSPQVGKGFNRDYWARFEKYVRDLSRKSGEVYVVTGPLWMPSADTEGKWRMSYPCIGTAPSLVSVPTHYFKVILADGRSNEPGSGPRGVGVGAFVMPNAPLDPKTPLSSYVVPLESLEAVAGTKFFPAFLNDNRRKALDEAATGWTEYGLRQLAPFERVTAVQAMAALPAPALSIEDGKSPSATASKKDTHALAVRKGAPDLPSTLAATSKPRLPARTGMAGAGAVHLCEYTACALPQPEFWLAAKQAGAAANARK